MITLSTRSIQDMWTFEVLAREYFGEENIIGKTTTEGSFITITDKFEEYRLVVDDSTSDFAIGDIVRHFKGGIYKIIGECIDANSGEEMFIYIALDGPYNVYCRPKKEFYNIIPLDKNYLLMQIYRFVKIHMN